MAFVFFLSAAYASSSHFAVHIFVLRAILVIGIEGSVISALHILTYIVNMAFLLWLWRLCG
jgi:hypothetical protein